MTTSSTKRIAVRWSPALKRFFHRRRSSATSRTADTSVRHSAGFRPPAGGPATARPLAGFALLSSSGLHPRLFWPRDEPRCVTCLIGLHKVNRISHLALRLFARSPKCCIAIRCGRYSPLDDVGNWPADLLRGSKNCASFPKRFSRSGPSTADAEHSSQRDADNRVSII